MSTGLGKTKIANKTAEFDAPHQSRPSDSIEVVIIFDFDGTLADVVPIFIEIYNRLAPGFGLKNINQSEYENLRTKSIWQIVRWTGLKPWQFPRLLREGRRAFAKSKDKVTLFGGVPELIKKLHTQKIPIYILSSNSERSIRSIMKRYGLDDEVIVMKRPWFFGKAGNIDQLVARKKYDKSATWMVGDEVRDVKAGKKAGVKTISVSWGLQDEQILKKQNPDFLVSNVNDLTKILTSQNN